MKEHLHEGIWVFDLNGKLLEANQAYADMSGYSIDELIGMDVAHLDAASSAQEVKMQMEMLRAKGHDRFDSQHRHKTGRLFDVDVFVNYVPGSKQFLAYFRDITERRLYEQALRESEEKYRGLFENAGDLAYAIDLNSRFTVVSETVTAVTGYSREELTNASIGKLLDPENFALARHATTMKLADDRLVTRYEVEITTKDGRRIPLELVSTVIKKNGIPVGVQGIGRDISERKRLETDLRIAAIAFDSQEAIIITDAKGIIQRVNSAFTKSTGYTAVDVVGNTPRILKSGRHTSDFYRTMWESILQTGTWQGEIWDRRKNGEVYPKWLTISAVKSPDGSTTHYVGVHIDISERKANEERIRQLVFHDPLTRLPNRQLLLDRLQQALVLCPRGGRSGALLFIDLDNFKTLNDTLGHLTGDLLLQHVAGRLSTCVRQGDTVARLGGDEFVVMLEDLSGAPIEAAEQTESVGEKILTTLGEPFQLGSREFQTSASIGAAVFSGNCENAEELLKQADIAMYQAKRAGRNTLRFFDQGMQETINARMALESELRKALDNREFVLHYQVQVDCSRRMLGAEALLRWMHPKRGVVFPAQFIHLAEETGLIRPIGQWVLETACNQLKEWTTDEQTRNLVLSVNISARQFHQTDFVRQVRNILDRLQVNPARLKLELTESVLLEDTVDTIATMNELKAFGVQLSLDDFGTGYSSLAYLKKLPLDEIKIDHTFVRDIALNPNDAAIVQAIIAMAKALGLVVVAEGVELTSQQQYLDSSGCNVYQGYLFGKPVPIEKF